MPRVLRRVGIGLVYSQGFHPRPLLAFAPALSLGVLALAEVVDVELVRDEEPAELLPRMTLAGPQGLAFVAGVRLGAEDAAITKVLSGARYLIAVPRSALASRGGAVWLEARVERFAEQTQTCVVRDVKGATKLVDVRPYVRSARLGGAGIPALVERAGLGGELCVIDVDVRLSGSGGVKAAEIVEAITGENAIPHRSIRVELYAEREGARVDPLDVAALRRIGASLASAALDSPAPAV